MNTNWESDRKKFLRGVEKTQVPSFLVVLEHVIYNFFNW